MKTLIVLFSVLFGLCGTIDACKEYYTIQSGDYPYLIATTYGMSLQEFYAINSNLENVNTYMPGMQVCVNGESADKTTIESCKDCSEACSKFYEIQPGDYLYLIAEKQKISYDQLVLINNNFDNQFIFPGMIICVEVTRETNQLSTVSKTSVTTSAVHSNEICEIFCIENCKSYYKVQPGDFPNKIALEHGISYENLLLMNNNFGNQLIFPDMIVCVDQSFGKKTIDQNQLISNENLITWEEFQNAFTETGYPMPTMKQYENFVKNASPAGGINTKRELAMFLAQIMWESGGLRYNQEIDCMYSGCPGHYETSLDYSGVRYYGRGLSNIHSLK